MYPLAVPFQHPSDDGLILYYSCFEGTGREISDLSVEGNHGTLLYGTKWGVGRNYKGFALDFDGGNDYLTTPSVVIDPLNDFTVLMSLSPDDVGANWQIPLSQYQTYGNYRNAPHFSYSNGNITAGMRNTADDDFNTSPAYSMGVAGKWYDVAAVRKGNDFSFYGGGAYVGNVTLTGTIVTPSNFRLGCRDYGVGKGQYFNGRISEVRIYNRALSAQEIRRHYEQARL